MKKLTALLLCLVLCVSMFAACGNDEPADTTKPTTPNTTEKAPETTNPVDTDTDVTTPGGEDTDDTTDDTDDTDDTTEDTEPDFEPVDLSDYIADYPEDEKLALEALGSKDAGQVAADYTTILNELVENATAITTLEQITDPYGNYYLTADISANAYTVPEFYGVLDACGHSITTSEPLFDKLGGGILNLNLAGDVGYAVEAKGVLANKIVSNATIINVKNTANVKVASESTETGIIAGGFAVYIYGENVVFSNCEFAGTLVNRYDEAGNGRKSGGFAAFIQADPSNEDAPNPAVDFINCTVSGTLTASCHVGGLYGEAVTPATICIAGCVNIGTVANTREGAAGGLGGYNSGTASGMFEIINCANNGTVSSYQDCGGLVGANVPTGSINMITVKWCDNYKEIVAGRYFGGIIGRHKMMASFTACVNYADLTVELCKNTEGQPDPTVVRNYVGGIVGVAEAGSMQVEYTDCVNYGSFTTYAHNARLGGISGHHEKTPAKWTNCVNFGNLTSAYVAPDGNTGDHRIGGITGGGNSNFEVYNCVNFGDMRIQMGKWGQPSGGIIGYVTNSGFFGMFNCLNYGDLDVTVPTLQNTADYYNTCAAGLAGRVTGINGITVTGCLNAGTLTSDFIVANFVNWEKASGFIEADMVINNNYYIAQTVKEGQVYGNFLYDDLGNGAVPNKINKVYELYQTEDCGKAVTMQDIADETTAGLAAVMTAKSATTETAVEFKCVTIKIDEVNTLKCIVPATILELIPDNIG